MIRSDGFLRPPGAGAIEVEKNDIVRRNVRFETDGYSQETLTFEK
jgi:hypothetical protein